MVIIIFVIGVSTYSQLTPKQDFKERLSENNQLFESNIDQAYLGITDLLKDAIEVKDTIAILTLLERKCRYFYQKNQIDSLIVASEQLEKQATSYNNPYSKAMSNVFLAEAYTVNNLHDKALYILENTYENLEKGKELKGVFYAKANVLNSMASVYLDKGEPEKAVEKLQRVIKMYDALDNPESIRRFQYLNYSNIASAYANFNMELAEYYALQSINLQPDENQTDKVMMTNYFVMGKVKKKSESYKEALNYYNKALHIHKTNGEELDIKDIYTDLIELYEKTGERDSVILYENKLNEIELSILKSKYNSLWKVMDKTQHDDEVVEDNRINYWTYIIVGIIFIGVLVSIFFFKKRNNSSVEDKQEKYETLFQLLKNNDPSYMLVFGELYPNFSEKLLAINPKLTNSEIEFCSLLKLNLSTKKIAKFTFLATRTVQNKKHRIRKKLNIPKTTDIYLWIQSL